MPNLKIRIPYTILIIVLFLSFGQIPVVSAADSAAIRLSVDHVVSNSEFKMRIAASSKAPINAFDIELAYPQERLDFLRASTESSIVSVWQYLPKDVQGNVIRLTGGMTQPFSGEDGEIITLIFFAREAGAAEFIFKRTEFAVADGKGTAVSVPETSSQIVIAESDRGEEREFQPSPPQIQQVDVISDPAEGVAVLSVKTEDDGAIRELLVRDQQWFLWSEWRKVSGLTAAVPKYAWVLQVAAIGWNGARSETTMYRWNIAAAKAFLILLTFLAVWHWFGRVRKN